MFNVKLRCIKFIKLFFRVVMIKSFQFGQGKLSLVIQRGVFDEKFWVCLFESWEGEGGGLGVKICYDSKWVV